MHDGDGSEDVCVLRLKDLKQLSGERSPSVESELHANILNANSRGKPKSSVAGSCLLIGQNPTLRHKGHKQDTQDAFSALICRPGESPGCSADQRVAG
ncbi:putative Aldolase [Pseudomonas syringae pv. atrofaciens]|nr:putative Aldolase [Pseudomonas syringae pv. atrofaciens]RML35889.1 putative Aldolase [Pseudomonas syringae pv. atrofaciens]